METKYILYTNPKITYKSSMQLLLEAYSIKFEIVADMKEAMKLGRGNLNPSGAICVAVNCDTKQVFIDFLCFCKDVKENQFLPLININGI